MRRDQNGLYRSTNVIGILSIGITLLLIGMCVYYIIKDAT